MSFDVFLLFPGLFVLILGSDFLVRGASSLALRFRITPLVVGLTIVAFGTSAPELIISVKSALMGSSDLTMGNVVGSNICNLTLVLGITAVLMPIRVNIDSIRIDWPITMGSSLLLIFVVRDGIVNMLEGVLFIIILILYNIFVIKKARKTSEALYEEEDFVDISSKHFYEDVFYILLGCVGLYYGSEWFIEGAKILARDIGVSERVIGITVLAFGTSLPELVTALVASFRKETDIAIGNLMGSNIFNILSILGITSIIKEVEVSELIQNIDLWWMIAITFIILPMMLFKRRFLRIEGAILVVIYIYYTYIVFSASNPLGIL